MVLQAGTRPSKSRKIQDLKDEPSLSSQLILIIDVYVPSYMLCRG